MIAFYIGWTFALVVTLAWSALCLFLAFHAGAEWKRRQIAAAPSETDPDNWRWLLGIAVVLEIILVLTLRYT